MVVIVVLVVVLVVVVVLVIIVVVVGDRDLPLSSHVYIYMCCLPLHPLYTFNIIITPTFIFLYVFITFYTKFHRPFIRKTFSFFISFRILIFVFFFIFIPFCNYFFMNVKRGWYLGVWLNVYGMGVFDGKVELECMDNGYRIEDI